MKFNRYDHLEKKNENVKFFSLKNTLLCAHSHPHFKRGIFFNLSSYFCIPNYHSRSPRVRGIKQRSGDILHGSLILANRFALLQLSGILTAWLVCDSLKIIHVAFTNQQGSIYTLFPHLQVSGGFLVGHMRGDNLNPIYHLGLGASHASFILPPIFLGSPNFIISFLTVFGYEVS